MIQIIGLIIAVYAIMRLIQVPFEIMRDGDSRSAGEKWSGLPFLIRFIVVASASWLGILVLLILTLLLLVSGTDLPR